MAMPSKADLKDDPSRTGLPNEFREYVVPSYDEFWHSLQSPIADIRDKIALDPKRFGELVLEPIKDLAKGFYLNPASMNHHDSQPGGLVRHTLNAILNILDQFPASGPNKHGATDRVTAFVLAFLHDLGRAHDCLIRDSADPKQVYSVSRMNQLVWVETFGVKRYTIEWFRERSLKGEFSSEPVGYGYLSFFFSTGIVSFLGRRRMNSLLHAACRSIGKPRYDYYPVLKKADVQAAKVATPHSIPMDEAFLPALAVAVVSEAMGFKKQTAWVGPTHTVVSLYDGHGHGLAWEEGVRVVAGHPDMSADRTVLDRLIELRPNIFAVWKRNPMDERYKYAVTVSVDSAPPLSAVILSNKMLWEHVPVEAMQHLRVPKMFFGDPDDCTKCAIKAEDVGFQTGVGNKFADDRYLYPAIQAGSIRPREEMEQKQAVGEGVVAEMSPPAIRQNLVVPPFSNLPPVVHTDTPLHGSALMPPDWMPGKISKQHVADFCERYFVNVLRMKPSPPLAKAIGIIRGKCTEEERNEAYIEVIKNWCYAVALEEQARQGSTTPTERT